MAGVEEMLERIGTCFFCSKNGIHRPGFSKFMCDSCFRRETYLRMKEAWRLKIWQAFRLNP